VALEVLHGALMLLGGLPRAESTEIFPAPGFWIFLARIQTVLPGLQFSNHIVFPDETDCCINHFKSDWDLPDPVRAPARQGSQADQ